MKLERSVIGIGAAFGIFVLIAAVVSDSYDDAPDFDASGKLIAEAVGAGAGVGTPGLNAPQMPQELSVLGGGMAGRPVGGRMQPAAIPGLVPFSRPLPERFAGRVVQVMTLGAETGWGQVHITIASDATGARQIVSLAPTWYLQYLGCSVMRDNQVSGAAFRFDSASADVPLYARTIKVNGRPCQLRSDEGFALWSNRLGQRP
ncbi:Magnetosome protein MamS [uncultured Gammaproteobacteria bacterium]